MSDKEKVVGVECYGGYTVGCWKMFEVFDDTECDVSRLSTIVVAVAWSIGEV